MAQQHCKVTMSAAESCTLQTSTTTTDPLPFLNADLYAGALFIQLALGFAGDSGLYISIMILLIIAALFTIAGGLTAVIWTDFVQTILMLIGSVILMFLSFNAVGGYSELVRKYLTQSSPNVTLYDIHTNESCNAVPSDSMHLFRSITPGKSDLPWTGVIFGLTISSIWYWCSDQVIVQRALASKNMVNAKGGCILAGYLKLLPLYLLVFPGMCARVLYPERVACSTPETCMKVCGSQSGCTNIAYAELVLNLMPTGLRGMMQAVMLAALMSSLTSIFNSSSTIFTIDIWTRLRNKPSDTELLIVGRVSVLAILAISVVWVPVINNMKSSQLFVYIQSVSSFFAPSVAAVYISAFFVPRTTEPGAFWGLVIGLFLGLFRFVLEFSYTVPPCGSYEVDIRPEWIKVFVSDIHYLHYGVLLFVVTIIITYTISIMTKPIEEDKLHRLTFWSRNSTEIRKPMEDEVEGNAKSSGVEDPTKLNFDEGEQEPKEKSSCMKMLQCMCGVGGKSASGEEVEEPKLSPREEAIAAAESLNEDPFWRRFVNTNAIVLISITIFAWAFYA